MSEEKPLTAQERIDARLEELAAQKLDKLAQEAAQAAVKKAAKPNLKSMDEATRKKYQRDKAARSRNKIAKKDAAKVARTVGKWDSDIVLERKEARAIFETDRLIRHPRALDVCVELAEVASRNLRIPFSQHLITHGVIKTLEARETKAAVEPPVPDDTWTAGNRLRNHELYALWDLGTSWRTQPDGTKMSFDRWLSLRRIAMTDLFLFGRDILGLDLHDSPHGVWARDLFVQKTPDVLPEKYTWEDVKFALAAQSPVHQRALIASRSSYKSSVNLVDLLQWVLCFGGDIRIYIISSTAPLSQGFLRKFRSYFTVKNPNEPTLFNQLFPEFMFHQSDDPGPSKNFISPMRQLDLIQPTLTSTSLDSEGLAGERMDVYVSEDIAEISNSSNYEQRKKTLEKFDMLRELLEPFGYLQVLGTPISSGSGREDDPGDIYGTLLAREEQNLANGGEPGLQYLIQPAWFVKEGVKKTAWDLTLKEDEVDLLFPSRLTFKVLMKKLRDNSVNDPNVKIFRQQSLCTWVPDVEDELKLNFDRDLFFRSCIPSALVPVDGFNVLMVDTAHTVTPHANKSAIGVIKIYTNAKGEKCMTVLEVIAGRFRNKELAELIVLTSKKYVPQYVVAEKTPQSDAIEKCIRDANARYQFEVYVRWHQPSNVRNAKWLRLKSMESMIEGPTGRLRFVTAPWNEPLYSEMEKLNGATDLGRNSTRKSGDDQCDVLALCQQLFAPNLEIVEKANQESEEMEKEQLARQMREQMHNAMFGPASNGYNVSKASDWQRNKQPQAPTAVEPVAPAKPVDARQAHVRRLFGGSGLRA